MLTFTEAKDFLKKILYRIRWSKDASCKILFKNSKWIFNRDRDDGVIVITHRPTKTYTHVSSRDLMVRSIHRQSDNMRDWNQSTLTQYKEIIEEKNELLMKP